jgi:sugar phosphate permease
MLYQGFFPGCIYLISSWYIRSEVQKRLGGFFLLATGLSAFGNILAYRIIQIGQHNSYKGWRWIYIVEGAITCVAGLIACPLIVDFPDSKRNIFLTEQEKQFILWRIQKDQGSNSTTEQKVTKAVIWKTAKDWNVWSFSFMYFSAVVGSYAWTLFLPIILQDGFGFSQELAFVLTTPPQVLSVIVVLDWGDGLIGRGFEGHS